MIQKMIISNKRLNVLEIISTIPRLPSLLDMKLDKSKTIEEQYKTTKNKRYLIGFFRSKLNLSVFFWLFPLPKNLNENFKMYELNGITNKKPIVIDTKKYK